MMNDMVCDLKQTPTNVIDSVAMRYETGNNIANSSNELSFRSSNSAAKFVAQRALRGNATWISSTCISIATEATVAATIRHVACRGSGHSSSFQHARMI